MRLFEGLLLMTALIVFMALALPRLRLGPWRWAVALLPAVAAMAQLAFSEKFDHIPKPIDVTIQYLRSGKPVHTYARAVLNRVGRTVANVEVSAWQEQKDHPIATLQAHFLIG